MIRCRAWVFLIAVVLLVPWLSVIAGQDTNSSDGTAAAPPQAKPVQPKHTHLHDLLITGTVFDHRGLSLPGTRLRIRRDNEKKSHWETYSNSRGEFAVRVPPGADYEMEAEHKGFLKQEKTVAGKDGRSEEKVILHMEPFNGGKS